MKGALRIPKTLQTQVPLSKQLDYRTPPLIQTIDSASQFKHTAELKSNSFVVS